MGRQFGSILNDYKEIGLASGAVLEAVFIGMLGRTSQKEQYGRCYIDGGSEKKSKGPTPASSSITHAARNH